jgi:hypothetical protein
MHADVPRRKLSRMPEQSGTELMIEGRVVHTTSNALSISFQDGPGNPFAVAVQCAGDGRSRKFGTLFGIKNGGPGTHVLTYDDGTALRVQSKAAVPSVFSDGDGSPLAIVQRAATSVAIGADGPVLEFGPSPEAPKTPELFRIVVTAPDGEPVARLDIIRKPVGWSMGRALNVADDLYLWWDPTDQTLKIPILGVRLHLVRPVTVLERDVLLGACVDMAIGLRPYIDAMR